MVLKHGGRRFNAREEKMAINPKNPLHDDGWQMRRIVVLLDGIWI